MKINYIQNTSEVFNENMERISIQTAKTIALYPDEGKLIRHIATQTLYNRCHILSSREKLEDYDEVDA